MTVQTFLKGLLMTLVSLFIAAYTQGPIQWGLLGITALATVLSFTGVNLFKVFESTSPPNVLHVIDIICALCIALANVITQYLGQLVVNNVVDWNLLWRTVVGAVLTFVVATWFAPPKKDFSNKKLFT